MFAARGSDRIRFHSFASSNRYHPNTKAHRCTYICRIAAHEGANPRSETRSKRSRKTDNDSITMDENNTRVQFSNRFWNVAWNRTKYHYVILFSCDPFFTVVAIRIATQQKLPTCRKDLGVIGV